ncbi:BadF/BadG/BcrA/BcrD ATPase family protein [Synechococcus sp. M16CYN]|uniref:BadF/BadG/BcrA/BcrD ATPase family protein n=1 Tax=Synechococcus sp. M16CYN TaxID=3103139 RepID=UPI0032522D6B
MLLAGFDAGQTSTRCRVSQWHNGSWKQIGEGHGPGVSHLASSCGKKRFRRAISCSAAAALQNQTVTTLSGAVAGTSGIEEGSVAQQQATALLAEELNLDRSQVLATGDERTALRGAFPNCSGILLVSGTGMICLGRTDRGQEHRCGGWGWLLDGAGSAFDLGHQGLQLSLRMADGRQPDHPLRQQLWKALDCRSSAAVKARVVEPDFGAAGFAALAPLVVKAADQGMTEAHCILKHSADVLAASIATVASELDLKQPNLVGHGGALEHFYKFRSLVKTAVRELLPSAQWFPASGDGCQGALAMAKELNTKPC